MMSEIKIFELHKNNFCKFVGLLGKSINGCLSRGKKVLTDEKL